MRGRDKVASKLKSVSVAIEGPGIENIAAIAERPAVRDEDRRRSHPQIPAVVRILPGATAAEYIAGPDVPFRGESIGIPADRRVVIADGITVQKEVAGGKDGGGDVAAADVETGVARAVADATFYDIAVAHDADGVVAGIGDHQPIDSPAIATDDKTVGTIGRGGTIENRRLAGVGA